VLTKSDFDITEAIRIFNQNAIEVTFIVPTAVGLGKSILDATFPVREFLREKEIHNYDGQLQGPEGKKIVDSYFVTATGLIPTAASLYRPRAKGKDGDPRIWFSKLPTYAQPNNLLAILPFETFLYVINVSDKQVLQSLNTIGSPLNDLLKKAKSIDENASSELILKLKDVAKLGWIRTIKHGDTGVGATLENCLGIQINSSKSPDYKGIEIKAKRSSRLKDKTRSTLFAQVANWEISALKSSAEILDNYGYVRNSIRRLNCSVSSITPNSQGLVLKVDEHSDLLHELHRSERGEMPVVSWKFEILRQRLLTKHKETFWVGAQTSMKDGVEHFHYVKVLHTRNPFASIFHTLCDQGIITVDHLIKRESGVVKEKGPLFKIKPSNLDLLFPPPQQFDLV
jgi:hypothetical protein